MKNIICLLETLAFVFGASYIVASDYEIVKTEREDDSAIEHSVAVSSREIYYGDLLYFATLEKNVSTEPVKVPGVPGSVFFSSPLEESAFCLDATLRYAGLTKDYSFEYGVFYGSLEQQFPYVDYDEYRKIDVGGACGRRYPVTTSTSLSPGQERVFLLAVLDMPALDEWNDPFWKRVRDDLENRESVTLNVDISYLRLISEKVREYRRETTTFELVVKSRPQQEMALLDGWFNDLNVAATKAKEINEAWYYVYFPVHRRNVYQLNQDKVCKVCISDHDFARSPFKEFNADLARYPFYTERGAIRSLIRSGNRKPPVTNFPTNDAEWREIESRFGDSLLKNEIHFMRICAKFFSDNTPKEQDELMASFDAWYNDLPLLQRYAFARQLQDDFVRVVKTKLLNTPEELRKHKRLRKNGELFKETEVIASPLPETK